MMPSLLFPVGPAPRRVETGSFSCPSCGDVRTFARVVVGREVRLFAIRVPIGIYGEYVECGACLATYRPEVLAYDAVDADAAGDEMMAEYQRTLRRVLALLVITDGRVHEAEVQTVQRVYEAVTGARLQREDVLAEAEQVSSDPTTVADYLGRVLGYLNDRGKEQVLRGAALVSGSDGDVHESEAEMVRRLGAVMKLEPDRVEAVLRDFA